MDYQKIFAKIKNAIEDNPLDTVAYEDYFSLIRDYVGTDFKDAHAENHWLRSAYDRGMLVAVEEHDWKAAEIFDNGKFRSLVLSAPYYFEDYLMAVEYGKPLGKQFYRPRMHYLKRYVDGYQKILDGELDFLSISMPKRAGKLIAHDCPVLTTKGFKKHGELVPGDYIYGIDGTPKKVIYKHPDSFATHKVIFSNGEEILTSAEHEWFVFDKNCNDYRIVETQDMERTGLKCGITYKTWRYRMPFLPPIIGEEKDLPVKPYSLGAWLGDGTTTKPLMTNDKGDAEIINKMIKEGYPLQSWYIDKNYGTLITTFKGLKEDLRKVGMCHRTDKKNKHIPEIYFTASFRQRVELLSGLIDTDGTIDKGKHRVIISTTLPRLRDDIIRLVSTFGLDCRYHTAKAKVSSSGIIGRSDIYIITFAPDFKLSTVLERKQNIPTKLPRRITVRKIERLETPVIGNCITVEDGVYRVGDKQILTHNSQLGINFVNMLSGREPDRSSLMEGTGRDLVKSFYRGLLEYLDPRSEYHYYDIFPECKITETSAEIMTFNLNNKSRFPTVMCRSIDSTQVGLSEATNVLYLDDCVEGREEAKNRVRLDAKWEVISGDVLGRAIEGTPIIICGTRYSLYDPIGRLQETMKRQGKRMLVLETPALDLETDESNFEYMREGQKVFTTQYFRDQREMLSAEQFESEFQQQPFEAKGILFPVESLNRYFELPVDVEPDTIVAACDTADSGSDSCSMPIAAIYGDEVYIIDVVFDDSPPETTKSECAKALIRNNVVSATFESNNAGTYFARDVNELITQRGYNCNIRTKRTISNKQTRIEFASDTIIKKFYFKDPSTYDRGSQYWNFMRELTTYTRSGKVAHDDSPDSLALLENELRILVGARVEIMQRPF